MNTNLPVHIYWFSGSGNTLVIAKEVHDSLSGHGFRVRLHPLERTDPNKIDLDSTMGLVVPVAGQSTYPFIWEFIEGLPNAAATPCFFVDTLGYYSGGILGPVRTILKRKGYRPLAAQEILMPNTFRKLESRPNVERKMVEDGKKTAREFCEQLVGGTGRWSDIPGYSWLLSLSYRYRALVSIWRRLVPLVIDRDACTRCGTCVRLCPEHSLTMDERSGTPVNGSRCTLCQRCSSFCPVYAIRIGPGKAVPYRAVSLGELSSFLKTD